MFQKFYKSREISNGVNPVRPNWYLTYVLKSLKDCKFYTGVTAELNKRIKQYRSGLVFATKHRLPVKLIYFEACLNKNDTYRREKYLKSTIGKRFLRNRLNGGLTG